MIPLDVTGNSIGKVCDCMPAFLAQASPSPVLPVCGTSFHQLRGQLLSSKCLFHSKLETKTLSLSYTTFLLAHLYDIHFDCFNSEEGIYNRSAVFVTGTLPVIFLFQIDSEFSKNVMDIFITDFETHCIKAYRYLVCA